MNVSLGTVSSNSCGHYDFDKFMGVMHKHIMSGAPLFHTTADTWDAYLGGFPTYSARQEHDCNCCKSFMRQYGNLAYVTETGELSSALFDKHTNYGDYRGPVRAIMSAVSYEYNSISRVFATKDRLVGRPNVGGWSHFHFNAESNHVHRDPGHRRGQVHTNVDMLISLREIPKSDFESVVSVLRSGKLNRANQYIAQSEWLMKVLYSKSVNQLWAAAAVAPAGFCNVNSGNLGVLIDDIAARGRFNMNAVIAAHNARTRSDVYMRPTEAPKAGTLVQATKLVEELGVENSLLRRRASIHDLKTLWSQSASPSPAAPSVGVFADVNTRRPSRPSMGNPIGGAERMTWARFSRTVLSGTVDRIQVKPDGATFTGMVTEAIPGSPGILKWDNPVSWYVYSGSSSASSWGLYASTWTDVLAISDSPDTWNGVSHSGLGDKKFLILEGCGDSRTPGLCLFPEVLKSEFHGIRSVIEAYSTKTSHRLQPALGVEASGIMFNDNSSDLHVRVLSNGITTQYILSQMD